MWQPILAESVYNLAFGKLVNAVVTRLINEVLAFDDISVEEGEQVMPAMVLENQNHCLPLGFNSLLLFDSKNMQLCGEEGLGWS